jgi:hypothetical protein
MRGIEMAQTPEQVVRAWNERFATQDVVGSVEFLSSDFQREGEWGEWTTVGVEPWVYAQVEFFKGFPDWTWEITHVIAAGEWVVVEFTETGTWTEPFEILPGFVLEPTGTSYLDRDCVLFRVNGDGKIDYIRNYVTQNLEKAYGLHARMMEALAASS